MPEHRCKKIRVTAAPMAREIVTRSHRRWQQMRRVNVCVPCEPGEVRVEAPAVDMAHTVYTSDHGGVGAVVGDVVDT